MKRHTANRTAYLSKLGFTLVELIIVIAVIGVLAAILIPTFANVIDKANAKSALSDAKNIATKYVASKLEDDTTGGSKNMPSKIVIAVNKAGRYYLFGYDTEGTGELLISSANELIKSKTFDSLVDEWSWNVKQSDLAPNKENCDLETDGAFYMVPKPLSTIFKGFTKDAPSATLASKYNFQENNIEGGNFKDANVVEGFLLGGTYVSESQLGGSGNAGEAGTPGGETPETPKYTITFSKGTLASDPKASVPTSIQFEQGELFTPASYTASYSFDPATDTGWYVFNGWDVEDAFPVTENRTITANWAHNDNSPCTITFDTDGGSLNGSNITKPKNSTVSVSEILAVTATKSGKDFMGWYCESTGVTYNPSSTGSLLLNTDLTMTAVWADSTYAVTINPNNGEASYKLGDYVTGATVALPTAPTKTGYVFDYWQSSIAEDTTEYGASANYTMPAKAVTFTAQFKDKYTVTFVNYEGATDHSITVNAGDSINLPATSEPAKPDTDDMHYSFTGWTCSLGGSYNPGYEGYVVVNDVVFTAQYLDVPKYQVSFTAGILAGNPNVTGIPSGFKAVPTTAVNPNSYGTPSYNYPGTGSDWVFDGWEPESVVMADASVTFVAQWVEVPYYTVTFEANGGALNLANQPSGWTNGGALRSGTNIDALVKTSSATKTNYTFSGWTMEGVLYTESSATVPFTKNVTFTATYEENTYTATFNAGAGTGPDYVVSGKKVGNTLTMPDAATAGMSKSGYVLSGWTHDQSGMNYAAGTGVFTFGAENATFTANWVKAEYTVQHVWTGSYTPAAVPGDQTVACGTDYTYKPAIGTNVHFVASITATTSISCANDATPGVNDGVDKKNNTYTIASGTPGQVVIITVLSANKQYKATFDANGKAATNMPANTAWINAAGDYTIPANVPTADGFNFTGWKLNGEDKAPGSNVSMTGLYSASTKVELNFVAQWEEAASPSTKEITVTCNDTWNEQNVGTVTVVVPDSATEVTPEQLAAATGVPQYFVGEANATISGSTATMNGRRLATTASAKTAYGKLTYTSYAGSGDQYICISNYTGLTKINTDAANLAKNYLVLSNITQTSSNYEPIGWVNDADMPFTGVFDGNNYAFALKMYYDSGSNVGIVALNAGVVKNIVFNASAAQQVGGAENCGTIAGQNQNGGKIYNCYLYTTATQAVMGSDGCGGITGTNCEGALVEYCTVNTTKTGCIRSDAVGGIAGYNDGTIKYCSGYSDPSGFNNTYGGAGGIVGENHPTGVIEECAYTGRVAYYNGTYERVYGVGGIAGIAVGGTIRNCYYANFKSGTVYICGHNACGGLIGHSESGGSVVNSYVYTASVGNQDGYNTSNKKLGIGYKDTSTTRVTVTKSIVCGSSNNGGLTIGVTSWDAFKTNASTWDWTNIWSDAASPYTLKRARYTNGAVDNP